MADGRRLYPLISRPSRSKSPSTHRKIDRPARRPIIADGQRIATTQTLCTPHPSLIPGRLSRGFMIPNIVTAPAESQIVAGLETLVGIAAYTSYPRTRTSPASHRGGAPAHESLAHTVRPRVHAFRSYLNCETKLGFGGLPPFIPLLPTSRSRAVVSSTTRYRSTIDDHMSWIYRPPRSARLPAGRLPWDAADPECRSRRIDPSVSGLRITLVTYDCARRQRRFACIRKTGPGERTARLQHDMPFCGPTAPSREKTPYCFPFLGASHRSRCAHSSHRSRSWEASRRWMSVAYTLGEESKVAHVPDESPRLAALIGWHATSHFVGRARRAAPPRVTPSVANSLPPIDAVTVCRPPSRDEQPLGSISEPPDPAETAQSTRRRRPDGLPRCARWREFHDVTPFATWTVAGSKS